jgi:hypothetical protein
MFVLECEMSNLRSEDKIRKMFSRSKEFCSYGINKLFTIQDVVCSGVYMLCKSLANQASSVTAGCALGAKFFFVLVPDYGAKVIF